MPAILRVSERRWRLRVRRLRGEPSLLETAHASLDLGLLDRSCPRSFGVLRREFGGDRK